MWFVYCHPTEIKLATMLDVFFSRIIESIYVYSNMSSDLSSVRSCTSFWVRRSCIFAVHPQSVQGLNTLNIQLIAAHNFWGICCFAEKPGIAMVFCSLPGFITWRHRSLLGFLRAQLYPFWLRALLQVDTMLFGSWVTRRYQNCNSTASHRRFHAVFCLKPMTCLGCRILILQRRAL